VWCVKYVVCLRYVSGVCVVSLCVWFCGVVCVKFGVCVWCGVCLWCACVCVCVCVCGGCGVVCVCVCVWCACLVSV